MASPNLDVVPLLVMLRRLSAAIVDRRRVPLSLPDSLCAGCCRATVCARRRLHAHRVAADVVGRLFVARLEVLVVHRARGVDSRDWPKPRRGGRRCCYGWRLSAAVVDRRRAPLCYGMNLLNYTRSASKWSF